MTPIITIKNHISTLEDRLVAYEVLAKQYELSNPAYAGNMRDRMEEIFATLVPIVMQLERMIELNAHTGVTQWNNVDIDMILNSSTVRDVAIGWQEALINHTASCTDGECRRQNHEFALDGLEDLDHLYGDWTFDPTTAKYDIDKNGPAGFALIKRESVCQIVWSKTVTWVRAMCSPCYPNQADLDSGTEGQEHIGILAYTLPEEYWDK